MPGLISTRPWTSPLVVVKTPLPVVFHINQESRSEALRVTALQRLRFGGVTKDTDVYERKAFDCLAKQFLSIEGLECKDDWPPIGIPYSVEQKRTSRTGTTWTYFNFDMDTLYLNASFFFPLGITQNVDKRMMASHDLLIPLILQELHRWQIGTVKHVILDTEVEGLYGRAKVAFHPGLTKTSGMLKWYTAAVDSRNRHDLTHWRNEPGWVPDAKIAFLCSPPPGLPSSDHFCGPSEVNVDFELDGDIGSGPLFITLEWQQLLTVRHKGRGYSTLTSREELRSLAMYLSLEMPMQQRIREWLRSRQNDFTHEFWFHPWQHSVTALNTQ